MGQKRVLVFGNPLVEKDAICLRILPDLKKRFPEIVFVEFDAVEDLEKEGSDLIILDCVEGIESVKLFSSLDEFQLVQTKRVSMHDFDLGQSLELLRTMGLLQSVKVFGVPVRSSEKKALMQVSVLFESALN